MRLAERQHAWRQRGIAVIGLGWTDDAAQCREFFEQTGGRATWPLYRAPWVAEHFGVEVTPTTLVLRPDGTVALSVPGDSGSDPIDAVERLVGAESSR